MDVDMAILVPLPGQSRIPESALFSGTILWYLMKSAHVPSPRGRGSMGSSWLCALCSRQTHYLTAE